MQELVTRLEELCQARGVEKFSAEEMVELLEDGEEIDWILDQVLPAAPAEARSELSQLLAEIASAVAPPPVAEEEVSEEEMEEYEYSDEQKEMAKELVKAVKGGDEEAVLMAMHGIVMSYD